MNATITWGRVQIQARAEHRNDQHIADVFVNGAARPFTLIGRFIIDSDPVFGNKRGRMHRMHWGWHLAHKIGRRRYVALAYRPMTGLPVHPRLLGAPAYAWWPGNRKARGL